MTSRPSDSGARQNPYGMPEHQPHGKVSGLRARLASPVTQFALAGMAAVLVVGLVAAYLLGREGYDEAIRDAKQVTALTGEGIVEPVVGPGVLAGKPVALKRLNRVVLDRVIGHEGIVRVKIWDEDSRIVYSDEQRLVGGSYELGPEELEILRNGGVDAETTDLSEPENRFEPQGVDLLEVYLPIHARSGQPLLYETYLRSSFVASAGQRVWTTLAPVLIGALLVLGILQLPLAISLARRLRRGQQEREDLLERAIDASEMERRRIAQDLHDGVVQDLAGVSYSVAAAANRAEQDGDEEAGRLSRAASRLRQSVRDLRALLVEIYPPDLHRSGLGAALSDTIGGLNARGLEARSEVPADLELPRDVETLFFRISQEAIRNVVAHADAQHLKIVVDSDNGLAQLRIEDDGKGFDTADRTGTRGHFGLRMLKDLTEEAGGTLAVDSAPGEGTRIAVEVPVK